MHSASLSSHGDANVRVMCAIAVRAAMTELASMFEAGNTRQSASRLRYQPRNRQAHREWRAVRPDHHQSPSDRRLGWQRTGRGEIASELRSQSDGNCRPGRAAGPSTIATHGSLRSLRSRSKVDRLQLRWNEWPTLYPTTRTTGNSGIGSLKTEAAGWRHGRHRRCGRRGGDRHSADHDHHRRGA